MKRLFALILFFPLALAQADLARAIFEAANAVRVAHGVAALAWDEGLAEAARIQGEDLLRRHYFGHVHPDGPPFEERYWQAGVYALKVAENLYELDGPYVPADFARRAVAAWMQSPGHRKNLLDPGFTHMGVAVLVADGRYLAVQEFAYEPFPLTVRTRRGEGEVTRYALFGQSPYPGLVLVAERTFYRFSAGPVRFAAELPENTALRVLLKKPGGWYEIPKDRLSRYGLHLEEKRVRRPGVWVTLSAPSGDYALGLGEKTPRTFYAGPLPARLFAPLTWKGLWIGRGKSYAYCIPLRP